MAAVLHLSGLRQLQNIALKEITMQSNGKLLLRCTQCFQSPVSRKITHFCSKQTLNNVKQFYGNTAINQCRNFVWHAKNLSSRKDSSLRLMFTRSFKTNPEGSVKKAVRKPENPNGLMKPALYTVGFCSFTFVGAAYLYSNRMKAQREKRQRRLEQIPLKTGDQRMYEVRKAKFDDMFRTRAESQQVAMAIIGLNFLVLACWKVPALQHRMMKYFVSMPGLSPVSMTLSTFSHTSGLHFFVNMYVLWSFASALNGLSREEFTAVYLSAGTISAFTSLVNKVVRGKMVPSVGASGAIMAMIGIVGSMYPNGQLSIAFIDMLIPHSFSMWMGITGLIALDSVGLALGWKLLDHAGHLGGMMTGLFYAAFGRNWIWNKLCRIFS